MSIPANSARHVVGWLACAVHAPGGPGVRRHAGAHTQGRGRVGGRAGAGGQGSASEDERRLCPQGASGERELNGQPSCMVLLMSKL